jgi:hypothetical protein
MTGNLVTNDIILVPPITCLNAEWHFGSMPFVIITRPCSGIMCGRIGMGRMTIAWWGRWQSSLTLSGGVCDRRARRQWRVVRVGRVQRSWQQMSASRWFDVTRREGHFYIFIFWSSKTCSMARRMRYGCIRVWLLSKMYLLTILNCKHQDLLKCRFFHSQVKW